MPSVRWKDKTEITLAVDDRLPVTDVSNSDTDGYTEPRDILALDHGQQTIAWPANAMVSATTNGAASGTVETTTNAVVVGTMDFDDATDEYACFVVPAMPKSWDEGTLIVSFVWRSAAATTGNCIWGLQAVAFADNDPLDAAYGTAQTVTDGANATAGDVNTSAETSAITVAGSPGAEEMVAFRVFRDANNASDTLVGDAQLIGVKIHYTVNAGNDD